MTANEKTTSDCEEIDCPVCGAPIGNLSSYEWRKGGGTVRVDCPHCGGYVALTRYLDPYIGTWHRRHNTCAGWADVDAFARGIGERPVAHGIAQTDGDVAACGACEECRAVGAVTNVRWIKGARARAPAVLCRGEMVSQAEAGRRLGISKEAVRLRVAAGTPLDAPRGWTGRHRGKGRLPKQGVEVKR